MGMTSFREVLEKMLVIVVLPVRKSLRREVELFSPHLVSNTCGLLASIVSELTASALGSEVTCSSSHWPMLPQYACMWGYCFGFKLWSLCALAKPHSHHQKFHLYMLIVLGFDKATFLITLICSFQRDLICIPVTTVQPTFEKKSVTRAFSHSFSFVLSCAIFFIFSRLYCCWSNFSQWQTLCPYCSFKKHPERAQSFSVLSLQHAESLGMSGRHLLTSIFQTLHLIIITLFLYSCTAVMTL